MPVRICSRVFSGAGPFRWHCRTSADQVPEDHREVLESMLALPDKYRDVVYQHYYRGYTAPEIGTILLKTPIPSIHC